jgi:cytochrome P450
MEMSIIDPELAVEILKRPKDFPNNDITGVILNIFRTSLLTTNGETWSRQRKLIAPNINEKISSLVFGESCCQAREMLSF